MDYLRTPDERFERLSGFQSKTYYLQNGDLRMAYIDDATGKARKSFFACMANLPGPIPTAK